MTNTTPQHLLPTSCYVCGAPASETHNASEHEFWSNADAKKYFEEQDRRRIITETPEERYINEYRPY